MMEKHKEEVTPKVTPGEKRTWHSPELSKNLVSDTQNATQGNLTDWVRLPPS